MVFCKFLPMSCKWFATSIQLTWSSGFLSRLFSTTFKRLRFVQCVTALRFNEVLDEPPLATSLPLVTPLGPLPELPPLGLPILGGTVGGTAAFALPLPLPPDLELLVGVLLSEADEAR